MIFNCVHFAHRTDREELFREEARMQGFDFEFWEPIPAPRPSISVMKSHQQIVQWAKKNNLSEVLIGEDDVQFVHPDSFQYFLHKKPQSYDLYFAGLYDHHFRDASTGLLEKSFSGLHCYLVHSRFYDCFLSLYSDNEHIDRLLAKQPGEFYCCRPMCCRQHTTYSDIRKRVINYDEKIKPREFYTGVNGVASL